MALKYYLLCKEWKTIDVAKWHNFLPIKQKWVNVVVIDFIYVFYFVDPNLKYLIALRNSY